MKGYDIIGDVHGCARALVKLLEKMGYAKQQGTYRHAERQAIFVGDIIDRGPRIREALHLVKNMVDAGSARCVMGNHEYNAIGYTTPVAGNGGFLRSHSPRHNREIEETLKQFADYPDEWPMFLAWFKTLPLFLEIKSPAMAGFRVAHACWDEQLITRYRQAYGTNQVDMDFILAADHHGSFAHQVMSRLTRGTELPLPDGLRMCSQEGYPRRAFRTKFWTENPTTYADVVCQPDPLPQSLRDRPLGASETERLIHYDADAPPVFVGHYWLQGQPTPMARNVACLDYGAVRHGRLVAYRYDGERTLNGNKFIWAYRDAL